MGNSSMAVHSNHTVTAKHSIIPGRRSSDRSGGLPASDGRDGAYATQAPLVRVLRDAVYEVRLPDYGELYYSTGTWAVSQTQYTYAVTDKSVAPAVDPWDELERLGNLVAAAWKSEKSGVELLLEERR